MTKTANLAYSGNTEKKPPGDGHTSGAYFLLTWKYLLSWLFSVYSSFFFLSSSCIFLFLWFNVFIGLYFLKGVFLMPKIAEKTVQITFRLTVSRVEQLDELCKLFDVSRREFFDGLIVQEYDKLQGNPKLKAMMQQLDILKENIAQMGFILDSDDSSKGSGD